MMHFPASLYRRQPRQQAVRRELSQQDLFMYEALVGKTAEFVEPAANEEASLPPNVTPIKTVARRWKPSVAEITVRLRTLCEQRISNGVKRPHVAGWLRHMSNQAFNRIDEAQARLAASRQTAPGRRRVEAREVFSIRPHDVAARGAAGDPEARHYKRVA